MSKYTLTSLSSDGQVVDNLVSNWATAHSDSSGTTFYRDETVSDVNNFHLPVTHSGQTAISRLFFYFDASAIPTSAQITKATFNIKTRRMQWNITPQTPDNIFKYYIQESTSLPDILTDTYSKFTGVHWGSVVIPDTNSTVFGDGIWNQIELNATGLSNLNVGGTIAICLRLHFDYENNETAYDWQTAYEEFYFADAGVGYEPYLELFDTTNNSIFFGCNF